MMFKKGGVLLALLLCTLPVLAQDKLEELFRPDNPNLINLNEPAEFKGQPLVYIEGVKAPEKATNDMEELQLKMFGTKKVLDATRDDLAFSDTSPSEPSNQIQNYTFQTPFHQTIQAAFIHHISRFMVIAQILDQNQIVVREYITVMNTDENLVWTRQIPLAEMTQAVITNYVQNDQVYKINETPQTGTLTFSAPQPLALGPNQISLTYYLNNPNPSSKLDLEITGAQLAWPIEKFQMMLLFPNNQVLQESKLTFGSNRMDIPEIYTQQADVHSNLYMQIHRIVPPNASIQANLVLDMTKLPEATTSDTNNELLFLGVTLLILYWAAYAGWTKYFAKPQHPANIKCPKNLILFIIQMSKLPTEKIWHDLFAFHQDNQISADKIKKQYQHWLQHPDKEEKKAKIQNICLLSYEVILGTILLLTGIIGISFYLDQPFTRPIIWSLAVISILVCILLYLFILKPSQKRKWYKQLSLLSNPSVISGLSTQQICQIYPLFVLAGQGEQWRVLLNQINPKAAQQVHLM